MDKVDKKALEAYLSKLKLIRDGGGQVDPFETKEEQEQRIATAKKDVAYMVETYLPHYASSKSAKFQIKLAKLVLKLPVLFILVMWGRALAKSVWVDVIIPLWLWMNDDIRYMVLVGNTEKAAKILLQDIQAEFEANELLIHDFGNQVKQGSWEDGYFETNNGFKAKAFGMRQNVRGLRKGSDRPDYVACDDLEDQDTVKNEKRQREIANWIKTALIPTMDGGRRRFLMANNHFHPITIMSLLIEMMPKWIVNRVNAYNPVTYKPAWPEKYDEQYYRDLEENIGTLAALAEYNNEPHIEGTIFKDEMVQWAKRPAMNHFTEIAAHWDVAYTDNKTSDYNAIRVMGLHGFNFWHIKTFCRQCEMEDAIRWMYDYEEQLPATVRIQWRVERQFWSKPVQDAIDTVEAEMGRSLNIIIVDCDKGKKYDRIITLHPYYQRGRMYYADTEKGSNDMQTAIMQLKGIEPGYSGHDDAPDAEQQCVEHLGKFIVIQRNKPTGRLGQRKRKGW